MLIIRCFFQLLLATWLVPTILGGNNSLKLGNGKQNVEQVYTDFDSTLSVDDFSLEIRNIFCRGEDYPGCNCTRFPEGYCNGTNDVSNQGMITALESLPGSGLTSLIKSFGGEARLNKVRSWLNQLRHSLLGEVYIVSTSWYPVTSLQWKLYLKRVSDLLGLGFDMDHIETLADPGPGLSANKGDLISRKMKKHNLGFDSAVLADDSVGNINTVQEFCNTIHLPGKGGLSEEQRQYITSLTKHENP